MAYYNNYLRNPNSYDRFGKRRQGSITKNLPSIVKKEDPAKEDRENRELVVNKIIEFIDQGVTIEEACKQIAQDKNITSKFHYLFGKDKIGKELNEEELEKMTQIYATWYKGKKREKKEIELV